MAAQLFGALILAAAGYTVQEAADGDLPLSVTALFYPPLWIGFVGVPV